MLIQKRACDCIRTVGISNERHLGSEVVLTDTEFHLTATTSQYDPICDSDEEDGENVYFLNHNTELPSATLCSHRSSYDSRIPNVEDLDVDDSIEDGEMESYYYGWKGRRHWRSKKQPYVVIEELFGHGGLVFPLTCSYEEAAREENRIARMMISNFHYGKNCYIPKGKFDKWKSGIYSIKDDEPLRGNDDEVKDEYLELEKKLKRTTKEEAKKFLNNLCKQNSDLLDVMLAYIQNPKENGCVTKTKCWQAIAYAASTKGWFRDPSSKAIVHYNESENDFDKVVYVCDNLIDVLYSDENGHYFRHRRTEHIPMIEILSCVPKMGCLMERKYLNKSWF